MEGKKNHFLKEKLNILWDVDKDIGTHISWYKKKILIFSINSQNTIVKTCNIIEENANQCQGINLSSSC
jgi:hypothetical protein